MGAFIFLFPLLVSWTPLTQDKKELIEIRQITEHVFVHTSLLIIPNYGSFPCNGLVYINEGKAVIIDTPTDSLAADSLYSFIVKNKKALPIAVIINHFHDDCLNTLSFFHGKGIPSYASQKCIELAKRDGLPQPQIGFTSTNFIPVGSSIVQNFFPGEAHSPDNIVSYIPQDQVLFGGCMIKEMNAKKGNLSDANIKTWSKTVQKVQNKFKKAKIIVPGHGKEGGRELFGYTIDLFHSN
ncbi:MAG: subclass B1 metallo-beta-lactamase [Crocinitomicaceae bacterium]